MKLSILLAVLFITSCSHKVVQLEPNKNFWLGKTGDELASHPVYASLEMEQRKTASGIETRTFKNKGGVVSSSGCYGANCNGFAVEVSCRHVFLLKKGIIADFNRVGDCGPEELGFRPTDGQGNPMMSKFEKDQMEEVRDSRGLASDGANSSRDCNIFGKLLKSQGCK